MLDICLLANSLGNPPFLNQNGGFVVHMIERLGFASSILSSCVVIEAATKNYARTEDGASSAALVASLTTLCHRASFWKQRARFWNSAASLGSMAIASCNRSGLSAAICFVRCTPLGVMI